MFVQQQAKKVFGAPVARVKGRVRGMSGTLSGGTAASAKATSEAVTRDLSLVAILKDPFALTPGLQGPEAAARQQGRSIEEDLQSWIAPFMMALINTRNVHRANMLMGFPYGQDFVYDEMVLTGPGEQGEANAKKVMAANAEKTGPNAPKPGEGPSKEERENGYYDLLYRRDRARRSPGPRRREGRPRSRLWLDGEDDRRMRDRSVARRAEREGRESGRPVRRWATA